MPSTADNSSIPGSAVSRRTLLGLMAGAGAALLAACGGAAQGSPSSGAAGAASAAKPSGSSASEPKLGGTLLVGQVGDLSNADGHSNGLLQNDTSFQAFEPLVVFENGTITPKGVLAESWDLAPDDKQITFHLRKGVQFQTGREFTSDDVKYNFERVQDKKNASIVGINQLSGPAAWWNSIETPDKYTVVLKSDKPRPGVFDSLQKFNMVDKETAEGPEGKTKSIGTGPFQLTEWVQGDHMTFTKHKNYWQSGKPYLDQFTIKVFRDPQAMMAQLEAGAIDVVNLAPISDVVRLGKDPNYKIARSSSTGQFFYVGLDTTKPPFDNKMVRQALNYSIDRKRWTDTILSGVVGPPQDLPWGPQSPAADPSKNTFYTQNLDKAKSLLASAGVSSLTFDITIGQNNGTEFSQLAQVIQSDLAKIGATANIKQVDQATFQQLELKQMYGGMYMGASNYGANAEASFLFTAGAGHDIRSNFSGFKSDKLTELVNNAASEPDAAKRKTLYDQMNDLLLDEAYATPLSLVTKAVITRGRVQGMQLLDYRGHLYTETWLA